MSKVKLIKKYKNRRLYDTDASKYVTIETLQHYIISNQPFRVIDSLNDKDLTGATLLQILMEMENGNSSQFLSPEILRQLIILAHHPVGKLFREFVEQLFANLEKSLESHPFVADTQGITRFWNEQLKNLFNQW